MFIVTILSLFFSLALLALFVEPFIRGKKPDAKCLLIGMPALIIGWPCAWSPLLAIQYLLLASLCGVDSCFALGKRTYLSAICLIAVLVHGSIGILMARELASLRAEFPYESMEIRLAEVRPRSVPREKPANDPTLASLEESIDSKLSYGVLNRRRALESLHGNTIAAFIDSPGFGVARMPTTHRFLERGTDEEKALPQPGLPRFRFGAYASDAPVVQITSDLTAMHRDSYLDFTYPEGFGFFKDRQHVAGFRSHQFRAVPGESSEEWRHSQLFSWKLQALDLVGLVLHKSAVAYVSDSLPRMDELRKAKTRPLDSFEIAGLAELRKGQALVAREQNERLRMLGAIRATQHCTACHDCERGDMLGAFSYVLRPR